MKPKTFKYISLTFISISILIQLTYILGCDTIQVSDFKSYMRLAKGVLESGILYPSMADVNSDYIWAPGYVNFLALILWIFQSDKSIQIINVLIQGVILYESFYLSKKYFNEKVGYVVLLCFAIYPTTYGICYYSGTELPFIALVLGVFCLYSGTAKYRWIILAGLLTVLANWIRPFMPVIIFTIVLMTFFLCRERQWTFLGTYLSVVALGILIIGTITYTRIGYFNYQSSTAGVNLIMGANDAADGSYDGTVFREGKIGFIRERKDKTFQEKNDYWTKEAIQWITHHPVEYVKLFAPKFFYMYADDSFSLTPLSGGMKTEGESREFYIDMYRTFPHWTLFHWLLIYNQVLYVAIVLLSLSGLYFAIKRKKWGSISIASYWILGTIMTLMTVGGGRYHFIYMPIIIVFASYAIIYLTEKRSVCSRVV